MTPLWGPDGDELFYRNGGSIVRVAVETTSGFSAGRPEIVIEGTYVPDATAVRQLGRTHDLSPDGQRVLMLKPVDADVGIGEIVVVQDWRSELERLVPTNQMPLEFGSTLGPYSVTAKIGKGGEVYRAVEWS